MFRRAAIVVISGVAIIALVTGSAFASHAGALVTCDSGDTFTIRAAENSAGFQSPTPAEVLIFEEGGVLTVQRLSVNGQLLFNYAETGRANNAIEEVTCSFTIGAGAFFEATGTLNTR